MSAAVELKVPLIDVGNTVGMAGTPRPAVRVHLETLSAAAGPVRHAVATYAARGDLAEVRSPRTRRSCASGAVAVVPGPDVAELVLPAHARRVHATPGCREFVVASADHRFGRLVELDVVAWQDQQAATRLVDVARRIHRVEPAPSLPGRARPPSTPWPGAMRPGARSQVVITALAVGIGPGTGRWLGTCCRPRVGGDVTTARSALPVAAPTGHEVRVLGRCGPR